MTYDEFNAFCRALPATTYVVQWGGSHVWKVGGKVFAIGGWADAGEALPGLSNVDLKDYLRKFHHIVSLGLSKKKQKEIGLNPSNRGSNS